MEILKKILQCLTQILDSVLNFVTLTLACKCRRKTLICRLFFAGKEPTLLHNLYHLTALCIPHMNWLFIVYDQDYGAACDEIFLLPLQILGNDPSLSSAWSVIITESKIWEFEPMLVSESLDDELRCMAAIAEELVGMINESEDSTRQVLAVNSIRSLAEIRDERRDHIGINALVESQIGNKQQRRSMDWYLIMRFLAMNAYYSEPSSSKPGS